MTSPASRIGNTAGPGRTGSRRARTVALALALTAAAAPDLAACAKKKPPPPRPPTVSVAHPLVRRIVDWDDYVGRFQPVQQVQVRARVSGYITRVAFADGALVRAGQTLFTIDRRPFQAALAQAKGDAARAAAALALARANLARGEKLVAVKAISQEDYDTLKATVAQDVGALATAQANVQAQDLNLGWTTVAAPIAGRVSDRRVTAGNLIAGSTSSGDVLTTIVSVDPIYFGFEGAENLYLKYQRENQAGSRASSRTRANPVEIRLEDETDYRWKGAMDFVDNSLDTSSGTIRGRAVVRNPSGFLTPGMFGHMRLLGSGAYDGLLIPDGAVSADQTRQLVNVVGRDGKMVERTVEPGPMVDGLRVIRRGLQPADLVVVDGVQRAKPGKKVTAVMQRIATTDPNSAPQAPPYRDPPASDATAASGGR